MRKCASNNSIMISAKPLLAKFICSLVQVGRRRKLQYDCSYWDFFAQLNCVVVMHSWITYFHPDWNVWLKNSFDSEFIISIITSE